MTEENQPIPAPPRCIWCNIALAGRHVNCAFGEGRVEHIHVKQPGDPVAAPRIAKSLAQQVREALRSLDHDATAFKTLADEASDEALLKLRRLLR